MPTEIKFINLNNLLPTAESKVKLSQATDIPLNKLNTWLDPDNKAIPKADSLVKIANYFECSVDYLLDIDNVIWGYTYNDKRAGD